MQNTKKVGIIGLGSVGATIAFSLMQSHMFTEMVLIDVNKDKAEGEAMDLSHGLSFIQPMQIYAGDYEDLSDAAIIIITAGANQKPGQTRLDLVNINVKIYQSIIPSITQYNKDAILLIVSNPVDVLTYAAVKLSGYPEAHVFGTGTVLDTARLKYLLGSYLRVDFRSIHSYIIGEHGDSEIPAWSSANVSGVPLKTFAELRGYHDHEKNRQLIADDVKNSAYAIIQKKHATYYGIGMAVKRICEALVYDSQSILPVSSIQHGMYGLEDVAISLPSIVGKNGVESRVPIPLNEEERAALQESARTLKEVIDQSFLMA